MDTRFSVKQTELILDCLIQSGGFMDFEKRGLPAIQEKFAFIMKEISEILEAKQQAVMFFSVFMEHQKSDKKTENVFQELSEQVKEVSDLTQQLYKRGETIFKGLSNTELCQLNREGQIARKRVIDAALDIKNIASFNLLMLQTVGRILNYIGYGLSDDELKSEQRKGAG